MTHKQPEFINYLLNKYFLSTVQGNGGSDRNNHSQKSSQETHGLARQADTKETTGANNCRAPSDSKCHMPAELLVYTILLIFTTILWNRYDFHFTNETINAQRDRGAWLTCTLLSDKDIIWIQDCQALRTKAFLCTLGMQIIKCEFLPGTLRWIGKTSQRRHLLGLRIHFLDIFH